MLKVFFLYYGLITTVMHNELTSHFYDELKGNYQFFKEDIP